MAAEIQPEDWWRFVTELALLDPKQMAEEGAEIPLPVSYKRTWALERDSLIDWAAEFSIDPSTVTDMLKLAVDAGLVSEPRSTTHGTRAMRVHVLYPKRIQLAAVEVEAPAEV